MQKKDDKLRNKTTHKEGKKGKKRAREKDRNRFEKMVPILALRMREKQVRQVSRKICFFLAKLVFIHSHAN